MLVGLVDPEVSIVVALDPTEGLVRLGGPKGLRLTWTLALRLELGA